MRRDRSLPALDDFSQTGAVLCNQCFSQDNGDGIAAIQHFAGVDFKAAIYKLADYLGVPANGSGKAARDERPGQAQPKKAANLATLTKGIKVVDHAPEIIEGFLAKYGQAKPPITVRRHKERRRVRWSIGADTVASGLTAWRRSTAQHYRRCPLAS